MGGGGRELASKQAKVPLVKHRQYKHSLLVSRLIASEHLLFVSIVIGLIGSFAYCYGQFAHTFANLSVALLSRTAP